MKPQLLLQEFSVGGINNKDVGRTRSRLDKSKSWKHQRVIVILPAGGSIPTKVALTHWNLQFPPNNAVARILALSMEVGEGYSLAIEQILAHPELRKWEYILTIEHDNMPPPHGLLRLLEHMEANPRFDAIGGLYFTKGHGGVAQIWGDVKDPSLNFRPQLPDAAGGLVECNGTGMGFNLWRLKMFRDKKLRKPWFKTETKAGISTQDLYFWADARKHGYRCAIACDVKIGHYDLNEDVVW